MPKHKWQLNGHRIQRICLYMCMFISTCRCFVLFPSYVLKYNADSSSFFQNSCHYMVIIYTVIKPELTSNY